MTVLSVVNPTNRQTLRPEFIEVGSRFAIIALLCVALALASDAFLTTGNLLNVARQAALLFLASAGLTIVVITGGLDLSVGATIGVCACLSATVLKVTGSPILGTIVAIAVGSGIGLANGLLVTTVGIPSFVATYGMSWILHGLIFAYMSGEVIYGLPPSFRFLGSGFVFGLPVPVVFAAVFLCAGIFVMARTIFGQQIYAIGSNREAAHLSGMPVTSRLIASYTLSGFTAAIAATVFLAKLNSAEGDLGSGLTLPSIAAVLIGGASLFGGAGTLVGTFAGALVLSLVVNAMNLLAVDANWQPIVVGTIIVVAVFADRVLRKDFEK